MNGKLIKLTGKNVICRWDANGLIISSPSRALQEITKVTCLSGDKFSGGECFSISSSFFNYIVYYVVDGIGNSPITKDLVSIKVDVISTDSAANVASKTAYAILKSRDFLAVSNSADLTITCVDKNKVLQKSLDINTGFVISTTQTGISSIVYDGIIAANVSEILDVNVNLDGSAEIAVMTSESRQLTYAVSSKNYNKTIYRLDVISKSSGWLTL